MLLPSTLKAESQRFLSISSLRLFFHVDSQLQGTLKSREREIGSLRRQLDACQDELAALGRDKDITIRENRRLHDDLATMTRENQVCSQHSRHSAADKE